MGLVGRDVDPSVRRREIHQPVKVGDSRDRDGKVKRKHYHGPERAGSDRVEAKDSAGDLIGRGGGYNLQIEPRERFAPTIDRTRLIRHESIRRPSSNRIGDARIAPTHPDKVAVVSSEARRLTRSYGVASAVWVARLRISG